MATGDDANMALPTLFTRTIAGHALRQCHGPRWPARRRDVSSTRQQRRIPGICAQLKQMLDSRAFRLSQIAALYAGASRGVGRQGLSQLVETLTTWRMLVDAGSAGRCSMSTRTTEATVTFRRPFKLAALEGSSPRVPTGRSRRRNRSTACHSSPSGARQPCLQPEDNPKVTDDRAQYSPSNDLSLSRTRAIGAAPPHAASAREP